MGAIFDGFAEAFRLLFTFDAEVWGIVLLSVRVSGTAVALASLLGIPAGTLVGLSSFRGKTMLKNLINTFMGFPPVVMGLLLFLLLSKSGPLGSMGLLYTQTAMMVAQFLLAVPIVAGTSIAAVESVSPDLKETVLSLGASKSQLWWQVVREGRRSVVAGVLVAFGQAISEVGAVMIVGGNIRWHTRTFTTAIVLQTRLGEFGMAIALGVTLLTVTFLINIWLTRLQAEGGARG
ncbi:MAG: ABC transporter permease [Promethearchaeota archaeon]